MKASVISLCVLVALLLLDSGLFAADRLVPDQYPTIQAAIDAADDNDTIIVAQGTYYENIDFGGKSITVTSTDPNDPNMVAATVIDAGSSGTVVTFPDSADSNCVLAGFTITGAEGSNEGGGIYCGSGTITITNCTITGNSAEDGGGMFNRAGDLTLSNCAFHENSALSVGGGIYTRQGNMRLSNCTFTGNWTDTSDGGGLYNWDSRLTLTNCAFSGNSAISYGGGLGTDYNSVTLTNCTFSGNSAGRLGGGMNSRHFGATATNCTFTGNWAPSGGGISARLLHLNPLTLINCTLVGNSAEDYGGGVHNKYEGDLTLTNCILWGNIANEGPQIAMEEDGTVSVSYSCLQGGQLDIYTDPECTVNWLTGNIDADPCFADRAGGDYHVRSAAGRWDANTEGWITDDSNSPCIDAGDPNSDWTAELWPHGKRINMGAFGGTAQASMSQSEAGNISDLDGTDAVDGVDLRLITGKWLYQQLLLAEDLNRDGLVNSWDFAIFTDNWAWKQ